MKQMVKFISVCWSWCHYSSRDGAVLRGRGKRENSYRLFQTLVKQ